ncbi:hypothetical protein EN742_00875 [Mesorhizobium sp. M4A.F.Ca.ET.020.02.1.1]|uniref:hypothetical protein n=1 Tax=Mesorhizobium sp. M4A.F.Ca.ET.020.02.1.1 TaxID=2496652 RepID=UPI000FD616D0|nr:hypothetical protein [Mesorhizobium sp. M4A.F.Ca.ET.020.02.1.1]RVD44930.1 hypothetical protein EN742_00875 [Mesorhizobium sp. M4A.F.Ca.ET.020.02.1.1]
MTPTIIHRFEIPLRDALGLLIGEEHAGSSEGWKITVEEESLVVDLVEPWAGKHSIAVPADFDHDKLLAMIEAGEFKLPPPEKPQVSEADSVNRIPEKPVSGQSERKGGPLAQRAAIACGEKGFWTFIGKRFGVTVASADDAATWLRAQCGIMSRVDLDYDETAAGVFREIDKLYRLWLEGFD